MTTEDPVSKKNAKPGKRVDLSNHCLSCGDLIPPNNDFCSEGCEHNFYDDSALERDLDEALAEQRELEREERKSKAGLFEEKM